MCNLVSGRPSDCQWTDECVTPREDAFLEAPRHSSPPGARLNLTPSSVLPYAAEIPNATVKPKPATNITNSAA